MPMLSKMIKEFELRYHGYIKLNEIIGIGKWTLCISHRQTVHALLSPVRLETWLKYCSVLFGNRRLGVCQNLFTSSWV